MGTWSVQSVTCRNSPLNTPTEFGTNWYVTYRIKYTTSLIGSFTEPPKMAWDEVILYVDYVKREYWEFVGNMYTRKPDSPTMAVWAQRYFRAYLHAHNTPFVGSFGKQKGHSKLFDNNGAPVAGTKLGTHAGVAAQNKAVRDYLKSNGGILEIEVHDIPNVLKPTGGKIKNVERILSFDCGVTGIGPRVKAWQYVKLDSAQPATSWVYQFQTAGSPPGFKTSGLTKIPPTAVPSGSLLPDGGIW
jgi:hypothetical protein